MPCASRSPRHLPIALLALLAGCGAPEPPASTGGTDIPAGQCGRGAVVVSSDYQSSNVSLIDLGGSVLSPSFISSGTKPGVLSAPLSGDVVLPATAADGEDVVLIDRHLTSVLTFVRLADAQVTGQLSVKTGFASNPQDFLPLADGRSYVTRFQPNTKAGKEPFDGGDDVLVIAPDRKTIAGRIELGGALAGEPDGYYARPSRLTLAGSRAWVLLQGYSLNFKTSLPSRLVTVDPATDALDQVVVLGSLQGCAGLARSPSGSTLAVACSGDFAGGRDPDPLSSGVALVDVESGEVVRLLAAGALSDSPVGAGVGFLDEQTLLLTTLGTLDDATGKQQRPDRLLRVDLQSAAAEPVLASEQLAFTFGTVACFAPCSLCFLADADRGEVHRFELGPAGEVLRTSRKVDGGIGLPPRALGGF